MNSDSVHSREFDVLIVGGGMVGAALGCLLQPLGLRVGVLERGAFPAAEKTAGDGAAETSGGHPVFDGRVSAISLASRDLLAGVGAWGAIAGGRCCGYSAMEVWDGDGSGAVDFTGADVRGADTGAAGATREGATGEAVLGYIVENSLILEALYGRLAGGGVAGGGVTLLSPFTVKGLRAGEQGDGQAGRQAEGRAERQAGGRAGGGIHGLTSGQTDPWAGSAGKSESGRVVVETEEGVEFAAGLVVAADGGRSAVRHLAGFETRQWDYGHEALVATVRTARPHGCVARQRFMDTGPLALLPLNTGPLATGPLAGAAETASAGATASSAAADSQQYCSIVWSMPPGMAQEVLALTDGDFCKRLGRAFEYRLGDIEWTSRRQCFPLRQCHAVEYVRPGIALVGDAAHSIHPLAGQGVNLGFADVRVLAEELQRGLRAGRAPGDIIPLRRYQRRRRPHNLAMAGLMDGFKYLFAAQSPAARWVRNTGMSGLQRLPPLKRRIARYATGR